MSRARRISSDLRHVAALAGTTAAVVEGAAIAADKARSVADHLHVEAEAPVVDAESVVAATRCRSKRRLLVVLLLVVVGVVGVSVWKKRAAARAAESQGTSDDADRFAGSMP